MFGNGAHDHWPSALIAFCADDDQPGMVMPGDVYKHLRHLALPDFGMAVNSLPQHVSGQLIQDGPRLCGEPSTNAARNSVHRGIIYRILTVRQDNACSVGAGQLACILERGLRLPLQIRGQDDRA